MAGMAGKLDQLRSAALPALLMVSAVNLLNYFDRSIFNLLLEPIRKEFSLSNTELGLLAGAFALLFATMSLPLAWASDRLRRLTVLGISLALWSVATAACGGARGFVQLFIARIAVGVGEAGCLPAGTSLIADHYPPRLRPTAIAVFQGAGLLGSMLGLMVIGVLADHLGWRLALICASLPGLLLVPLAFLLREPPRGRFDAQDVVREPWLKAVGDLLKSPVYLLLLAAITFVSIGFTTIGTWGPTFFVRFYGLSLSSVGLLFGLSFGLAAAAGTFLGGWLTSRLMKKYRGWEFWMPATAYGLAVPLFVAALAAPTATLAFALVGVASFTAFLGYGPTMSLYHVVAPPEVRATAVSGGAFFGGLIGSFVGPVLVGGLTDSLTPAFGVEALRIALGVCMLTFVAPAALYPAAERLLRARRVEAAVT